MYGVRRDPATAGALTPVGRFSILLAHMNALTRTPFFGFYAFYGAFRGGGVSARS